MVQKPQSDRFTAGISQVRSRLAEANRVVVLTGAGISAESGVPTFRGEDGLWRSYRAEELATPEAFSRDSTLVWEWYDWRRGLIAPLRPNPGHDAVASLEDSCVDFTLITQNVDGLHRLAGSRKIQEIHGNIWQVRCTACDYRGEDRRVPIPVPPLCPQCEGLLRPDIVWFGEQLSRETLDACAGALSQCEVMLVVGTSGIVQPAASMAAVARKAGAFVAEVNIEAPVGQSSVDLLILGKAGEILPRFIP